MLFYWTYEKFVFFLFFLWVFFIAVLIFFDVEEKEKIQIYIFSRVKSD